MRSTNNKVSSNKKIPKAVGREKIKQKPQTSKHNKIRTLLGLESNSITMG